jgi:GTP-binding protein
VADLLAVREEVARFDPALLDRPQLLAATKRDAVAEPDPLPALRQAAAGIGLDTLPVSAVTGEGLARLKRGLLELTSAPKPAAALQGRP